MYERLGAPAWHTLARRHHDRVATATGTATPDKPARVVLRRQGDTWTVSYAGQEAHLPDLKGLHDLAALVDTPGRPVHVMRLLTGEPPTATVGADAVLDASARAAYRQRLAELDAEADRYHDPHRAERARLERDALLHELAAATGLGHRDRRLGDATESARKTVSSRIRDALRRIERVHPALARHLDSSVATGIWCSYTPQPGTGADVG